MAEGARLESVYTATYRGFESLSLRHNSSKNNGLGSLPALIPHHLTAIGLRVAGLLLISALPVHQAAAFSRACRAQCNHQPLPALKSHPAALPQAERDQLIALIDQVAEANTLSALR